VTQVEIVISAGLEPAVGLHDQFIWCCEHAPSRPKIGNLACQIRVIVAQAQLPRHQRRPLSPALLETFSVLVLTPSEGISSRWRIHDVTGLEHANTLLVLRESILASRNLPILLYRVHLRPNGPPTPYDAHGFDES
jgi:hypothetical protein